MAVPVLKSPHHTNGAVLRFHEGNRDLDPTGQCMSDRPGKESTSAPTVATDVTRQELPYRLRQQSLLGEFGRSALQTRDIGQILQRATELCAQGLDTRFAKVLEYLPNDDRLLVRAGVGWEAGIVGRVSLGLDLESPAGYAFQTGQMVISNHLQEETRFRTPKLLTDHGIRRAINVLIARGGEGHLPFGVLEVDSPEPGQFDVADADFLAGFAGLIQVLRLGAALPSIGDGLELQAVAAAVIGGTALSGGIGNVLGAIVGALLIRVIDNGLVLTQVDANWFKFAVGSLTIFAVVANAWMRRTARHLKVQL